MSLRTTDVLLDELSADPSTPTDGQLWYNTTTDRFKGQRGGVVKNLTDKEELEAHSLSTTNPHSTTLEQARTAGATFAGDMAMGNNAITGLKTPVNLTDATNVQYVRDQINAKIRGLDWQNSVLSKALSTPPGSPADGDRYIVKPTGLGLWAGHDNHIAQWDSGTVLWIFTVPNEGFVCEIEDENVLYIYDGSNWAQFGSAITTGTPVSVGTSNQIGAASSLSRSDHVHDHGSQTTTTHHAVAGSSGPGFQPKSNAAAADPTITDDSAAGYVRFSRWVNTTTQHEWTCLDASVGAAVWKNTTLTGASGYLVHKAGRTLAASFSGTPRKATVVFSAAFADANYAVTLTPVVSVSGAGYSVRVESQIAGSFVINMGTASIASLIQVNWVAVKDGEST